MGYLRGRGLRWVISGGEASDGLSPGEASSLFTVSFSSRSAPALRERGGYLSAGESPYLRGRIAEIRCPYGVLQLALGELKALGPCPA